MPLAEHDNVVKTFPADRTDRPFCHGDRAAVGRSRMPIARRRQMKNVTVDGVAVADDVSRFYFPTIGLGELARNPFSRRVRGHLQSQDLAAILMQYQ